MDEDRIDFSALDPRRDPARFERMVQAVTAGAMPVAVHPLLATLIGWGRVAVACGALAAVAAWTPALVRGPAASSVVSSRSDLVALVSSWARSGAIPGDADLTQVLESADGR